jgi:hypothetical protein
MRLVHPHSLKQREQKMSLFIELYDDIKTMITNLPTKDGNCDFTTHEFILLFAQQKQYEYIQALYEQKEAGKQSPFRDLHKNINDMLKSNFSDLIIETAKNQPSNDIFGNVSSCSYFKKVS